MGHNSVEIETVMLEGSRARVGGAALYFGVRAPLSMLFKVGRVFSSMKSNATSASATCYFLILYSKLEKGSSLNIN